MTTLGTRIFTALRGRLVGKDSLGNSYYEDRRVGAGNKRQRRWVIYAGVTEASAVPAEWFGWLHYTSDAALPETVRKPWQKPFEPNLTGTGGSYRPAGHDYSGGKRVRAPGDYEAWSPDE